MRAFLLLVFVLTVVNATVLGAAVARAVRNDPRAPAHCLFSALLLFVLGMVFVLGLAHN